MKDKGPVLYVIVLVALFAAGAWWANLNSQEVKQKKSNNTPVFVVDETDESTPRRDREQPTIGAAPDEVVSGGPSKAKDNKDRKLPKRDMKKKKKQAEEIEEQEKKKTPTYAR